MSNEYGEFMDSRDCGTQVEWAGCCVRFSSRWGYPEVHTNSTHISVGVKSVRVNEAGELQIEHDGGPIVTMIASPDETLVAKNIQVGLSRGGGTTIARFYDGNLGRILDLSNGSDWLRVHDPYANLWLAWLNVTGGRS